ncbi:efflux RND transporter periplasmic adaptor subunit [Vibrio agarivorans]|uniref:Efflux RND transporter periplasmic adaptor subunit n=1 Tax=Vibrio agarivorans TaxID=153622 RepID=A0ABT7XYV4_9VIBR|nr:efflux RND transporter periplasmic adaptor subunit [Vibrio agarivorans]MDN2480967.1 efflux RND transporter periplasmic adaptor subunit [Vibrio agarivorans]
MNKNIRWFLLLVVPISLLSTVGYRLFKLTNSENVEVNEISPIRVQTHILKPETLTVWVYSEGIAQAQRKAFLDFEISGKVESIATQLDGTELREGSRVFGPSNGTRNGQLLAQIDNRDNLASVQGLEARLKSVKAQREEAKARAQQARNDEQLAIKNYERMKEVFERGVIAKEEFERVNTALLNAKAAVKAAQSTLSSMSSEISSVVAELNRATLSLEKTSLFAPFDGVITSMNISKDNHYYALMNSIDDMTREANSAIVIVDDREMEIHLEINTLDAAKLEEGQTVYLASDDETLYSAETNGLLNELVPTGEIWSVSPSLNLQRRNQTVKVRVQQTDSSIKEGQFIRAWIETEQIEDALVLPLHAISFKKGNPFVFVFNGNENRVTRRNITLGEQGTSVVEVTSGLETNEEVVIRGQHLLIDGASAIKVGAE